MAFMIVPMSKDETEKMRPRIALCGDKVIVSNNPGQSMSPPMSPPRSGAAVDMTCVAASRGSRTMKVETQYFSGCGLASHASDLVELSSDGALRDFDVVAILQIELNRHLPRPISVANFSGC
jgi:hypothetical protein